MPALFVLLALAACGDSPSSPGYGEVATGTGRSLGGGQPARHDLPDNRGFGDSLHSRLSADGRTVVFDSISANQVALDHHNRVQVYQNEGTGDVITPLSLTPAGQFGRDQSLFPRLDGSGAISAFLSDSADLVTGDTNGLRDLFVQDGAAIRRVSVDSAGNEADGDTTQGEISADGRYVALLSSADNLVGVDGNNQADVFRHDRNTGVTLRVSVTDGGAEANGGSRAVAISADGNRIGFISLATNLVVQDTGGLESVFVRDVAQGSTVLITPPPPVGAGFGATDGILAMSADGRRLVWSTNQDFITAADGNGLFDVFLYDNGTLTRVSEGVGAIEANNHSFEATISADGGTVAFISRADNLITGDTNGVADLFIYDVATATLSRPQLAPGGSETNGDVGAPALSADGRHISFATLATNLDAGDNNDRWDVYVHDRQNGGTRWISRPRVNPIDGTSLKPMVGTALKSQVGP